MTASDISVVNKLKEYRNRHYSSRRDKVPKHIGSLVYTNLFAFLVGSVFQRGGCWEKMWEIPYWIDQKGMLDASKLAAMAEPELERLLKSLRVKPRWGCRKGAKTLKDAALLVRKFGGDTAAIWRDASPVEVKRRLQGIREVGPEIASMFILILHDEFGMFRGQERQIDVKSDVHVMRVFKRTGLTPSESENEARNAARELNPDFPGELDGPAWEIGQKWCKAKAPECTSCPLTAVCPKHISCCWSVAELLLYTPAP